VERSRTGWQEFYPSARSPARTPPRRAYFVRGALACTSRSCRRSISMAWSSRERSLVSPSARRDCFRIFSSPFVSVIRRGMTDPRRLQARRRCVFRVLAECLNFIEGRFVLAGRLTGPRPSWDTLAVPARASSTESSPVPLDAKVDSVHAATGRHGRVGIDLVSLSSGSSWNGIRVHQGRDRARAYRHFSTAFRRLTNITPGRYRQGLR